MIPRDFITAWRSHAPWAANAQVEQDLVISRALIDIFTDTKLASSLAFRGGTALYKLFLTPAARYSEDIDLVQVRPEPIGDTLDSLRAVLSPWLGEPRRQLKDGRANLVFRFHSEDSPSLRMRLKIEINTREHFSHLGLERLPFTVESDWFHGKVDIATYAIEELLGTKLRALYQRKKGRDLFDLWHAMTSAKVMPEIMIQCFLRYMKEGGHSATRAQFEQNLAEKRRSTDFREDMAPLLRSGTAWDFDVAMDFVLKHVIGTLPGDPWKGLG